jgi:hypothetical protein
MSFSAISITQFCFSGLIVPGKELMNEIKGIVAT